MINTVYGLLKGICPVKWLKPPNIENRDTVMGFHFFGGGFGVYGNGEGKEKGGSLQVDIYSKADYSSVCAQADKSLTNAGFRLSSETDVLDELDSFTPLYHKILIYNYTESEVKKSGQL